MSSQVKTNFVIVYYLPFKEICVFGLLDEASTHHNRLEALSFDGPKLALGDGRDGCSPLTIVENGQLAQNLGPRKR